MRNIIQLIDSILLFIPQEEFEIIEELQKVVQSAQFSAPELMQSNLMEN